MHAALAENEHVLAWTEAHDGIHDRSERNRELARILQVVGAVLADLQVLETADAKMMIDDAMPTPLCKTMWLAPSDIATKRYCTVLYVLYCTSAPTHLTHPHNLT